MNQKLILSMAASAVLLVGQAAAFAGDPSPNERPTAGANTLTSQSRLKEIPYAGNYSTIGEFGMDKTVPGIAMHGVKPRNAVKRAANADGTYTPPFEYDFSDSELTGWTVLNENNDTHTVSRLSTARRR